MITELNLSKAAEVTMSTIRLEAEGGADNADSSFAMYVLWGALTGLQGPELALYIHSINQAPGPVTAQLGAS